MHGPHHIRVGIEGAARKAQVGRALGLEAAHQRRLAADHADRKTAAQGLAVDHQIGLDAEIFLRAARCEPEADEHLVQDQHDAALAADLAQLAQPVGVGRAVEAGAAAAVDQGRVARRVAVRMQRLQRIDQHAGDVLARAQHLQGTRVHVIERIGLARRQRIAGAGLHILPPAMVGAGEAHQMLLASVIARQPHRLHHGLGARHVKTHLVQARELAQPVDVLGHAGVIAAQHGTERRPEAGALLHALLVEIDAEDVDAVGAGQVVIALAVEVLQLHPLGRLPESAHRQLLAHIGAELERHAVAPGQLQVGQALARLRRQRQRARRTLAQAAGEPRETGPAPGLHLERRVIDAEEFILAIGIARQQPRDALGHARMPGQRGVLGARELESPAQPGEASHQGTGGHCDLNGHVMSLSK